MDPLLDRWYGKLGVFAPAALFTWMFFINWCDWVFDCGCTFIWAGGAAHCNIHTPGPPDCPWCTRTDLAGLSLGFTLVVQGAILFWPGSLGPLRVAAAFVASPLAAAAAGVVTGWVTGYWT